MIRPLRRRHRWLIPGLFLLLAIAGILSALHPTPSARVEALPSVLIDADGGESATAGRTP
jgi:hypothetical protein